MALDDFAESEVAIAVAATAAVLSPQVRGALRKGAVYGLAGVLTAGDMIGSFVSGFGRGVQQATPATAEEAGDKLATMANEAKEKLAAMANGAKKDETPSGTETAEEEPAPAERRTRRTRAEAAGGEAR